MHVGASTPGRCRRAHCTPRGVTSRSPCRSRPRRALHRRCRTRPAPPPPPRRVTAARRRRGTGHCQSSAQRGATRWYTYKAQRGATRWNTNYARGAPIRRSGRGTTYVLPSVAAAGAMRGLEGQYRARMGYCGSNPFIYEHMYLSIPLLFTAIPHCQMGYHGMGSDRVARDIMPVCPCSTETMEQSPSLGVGAWPSVRFCSFVCEGVPAALRGNRPCRCAVPKGQTQGS